MRRKHILTALIILLPLATFAQDGYTYQGLSYSMSVPSAGMQDYIDAGSFRGVNYEGYHELSPKFAFGWLLGWNVFKSELRNETYVKDNATIHGNQYRYQNEFPILVRGLYLLGAPAGIRPYIGAGLGTMYSLRRTDIGLYSIEKDSWHFAVAPEIGIFIPVRESKISASVRYNYGVKAGELGEQSYVSFNLGFMLVP
jgi:hypothetical protein